MAGLSTTIPLGDVASASFDGVPVEICGSTSYNLNSQSFEQMKNTNGWDPTQKRDWVLGSIELVVRISNTFNAAAFTNNNSVRVVVVMNDGSKLIGQSMYPESPPKVNVPERSMSVSLKGISVVLA